LRAKPGLNSGYRLKQQKRFVAVFRFVLVEIKLFYFSFISIVRTALRHQTGAICAMGKVIAF